MIDNDVSVSDNYQRLIMATIDGLYSDSVPDTVTKKELRERIIGKVRSVMGAVFPDLLLDGVGSLSRADGSGTFYFSKGSARYFLYKNLSAGEKAAFDLILDAVVKAEYFDNTIWCIDEPETHLNTRIQAALLEALFDLLPDASQMILASHSIGFMRKAWDMAREHPDTVVFLDLQDKDFDKPVVIEPTAPTRSFWARTLDVALGDLAQLMAPEHVVLCEGRPAGDANDRRAEFDASCYRVIFARQHPETDFLSVGNSHDVANDRLEAGRAIQTVASGTAVTRVVDRDLLSPTEVSDRLTQGIRVLSRRNIEAYLLDDEVLTALCTVNDRADNIDHALRIKADAMAASVQRGNDPDDWKKAAGQIYTNIRRLLLLQGAGSDWHAFARDTLSPLIKPDMRVYQELHADIFGSLL